MNQLLPRHQHIASKNPVKLVIDQVHSSSYPYVITYGAFSCSLHPTLLLADSPHFIIHCLLIVLRMYNPRALVTPSPMYDSVDVLPLLPPLLGHPTLLCLCGTHTHMYTSLTVARRHRIHWTFLVLFSDRHDISFLLW